jgi:hypothetical protein
MSAVARSTLIAARVTDDPFYGRTADGYGGRIATRYMVRLPGDSARWRRVYAMCYGNAASIYVTVRGTIVFIDDHEIAAALAPHASAPAEHATPSSKEDEVMDKHETCRDCGAAVHYLEVFPGPRCITCWTPLGERRARTMTADELARMWGAR